MTMAALSGIGLLVYALYIVSIALVVWAVVDVVRRPAWVMSAGRKVAWVAGLVVGWFVLGLVGGIVAALYLGYFRKRLPTQSSF
jgi:hypothetical protein